MSAPGPTIQEIYQARDRLQSIVRRTPLQHSSWLSEQVGVDVYLKLECWQRTNSFKMRGAYNAVAMVPEQDRDRGLVTASAGNHGQAVALAARLHGAAATIFVPDNAPETKKRRIQGFGAELREAGSSFDEAAAAAREFSEETGAHYVHAFSDAAVVAGQGTVGLEIVEDLPTVETIVVPVGGGGLIGGIGIAIEALTAGAARVVGAQSDQTASMHAAFEAGRVVDTPMGPTLCDGLAGEVDTASYERARPVVEGMVLVPERNVAPAIRALFQHEVVVAEGGGAVGIAALLAGKVQAGGPVVAVVSGGNIDGGRLAGILAG